MSFPPTPKEWASDTNYPAGSDPWSGTATKANLTAETKARGMTPEGPFSAQQANRALHDLTEATNCRFDEYLTSGTWTPVEDVVVEVDGYGSGGAGAGGTPGGTGTDIWTPGGGGGKARGRRVSVACPAGTPVTVTIGASVAGAASGVS